MLEKEKNLWNCMQQQWVQLGVTLFTPYLHEMHTEVILKGPDDFCAAAGPKSMKTMIYQKLLL